MNLIKIIKKFLFIQNITASIFAKIPPYLEFTVGKYELSKKHFILQLMIKLLVHILNLGCLLEVLLILQ